MTSRPGRYPLEAARSLRAEQVDRAQKELARALRELEAVEGLHARAVARTAERAGRISSERAQEIERDRGERSAAEMLSGQAWLRRLGAEHERAQEAERAARTDVKAAEAESEKMREQLAQARAEAEAVERHYQRWQQERKRVRLAKEEAEAEEHTGSKRG